MRPVTPDQGEDARTTVHVMRHGEVHNPERVLYGRLADFHLSALGHEMAHVVADYLRAADLTHLVSSPLDRARETMAPCAEIHGVPVTLDERVIEAANHFEGKTFGHGSGSPWRPANAVRFVNPFRPSWGEPYVEIAARMRAAITDARDAARGHEALIVSHQLPIWVARCAAEQRPLWHDPRSRECTLASITSFTFVGEDLESVGYVEPAAALLAGAAPGAGA